MGAGVEDRVRRVLAKRELERRRAKADPAYLFSFMRAVDERTGEVFSFEHCRQEHDAGKWAPAWPSVPAERVLEIEGRDWSWQRDAFLWLYHEPRTIALKARQLGFTWLGCGACMVDALIMPGSLCLIYRQKEEEAIENIRRCWMLFQSLPSHLRMGVEVLTPQRGSLPSTEIKLRHPNGKISRIVAMTSASASGHGKTARRTMLDEHSRIERAAEIMKAVQPAAGLHGKIMIISTANGRSDPETGDGNQFHWTWTQPVGFSKRFLSWAFHPDRDQEWYDTSPEVQGLKHHERAEQYPSNEHEAFTLTNKVYFEPDDLAWYASNAVRDPLYKFDFVDARNLDRLVRGTRAKKKEHRRGMIGVYEEPIPGHRYAIFADVATGHGRDYSAAYVVDLSSLALAAEFHGKIDEDLYAAQLHYLGRMYGRDVPADPKDPQSTPGFAKLAVETQGGFGNAVIAALRDRTTGRPAYGNLYRNVLDNRGDKPIAKPWGFPMNSANRPKAVSGLDKVVREHALPWVTHGLLHEMGDFVRHDTGTSPAAAPGTNDDRVMAACGAVELYRLYGHHAEKPKVKPKRGRIRGLGRR